MFKAHQIKLYPTRSQELLFRKSCGVSRFSYNWALSKWIEDYNNGIKQSAYSLVKHLNSIKKVEFPWMQEVGKTCSQYAIHNVESAFKMMWKTKSGFPKFKKKGTKDSFLAIEKSRDFTQRDYKIHIPRVGKVKCAENLRFNGKVNNVVVKRIANTWFAVVNIEIEEKPIEVPATSENQAVVGIDMGIKSMLVLSDGTVYDNPKALKSNLKSLRISQRKLSRKKQGSNNWHKQRMRIAVKYHRISNIRKNAIHQATTAIINKYDCIVIESLNLSLMSKNHCLAQAISDVSFGEIVRQLTYKSQWYGKQLVKADRWFPSSKICSCCGHKKQNLKLSERIFKCENCGFKIDRDLNAAKNLAKYSPTLKYEGSKASGVPSSSSETKKRGTMNDEITNLCNSNRGCVSTMVH